CAKASILGLARPLDSW
nr:immunoglobulin heavy chain junction region [Macaca mulatta]MOV37767.1 immunoglobulin heavy chain junction region [Macaca mulatta]MOV38120.1 immunoglobulin heavy chain junction region [Macaca mulatta]MOV38442.1 immunoglobulin heavy chain junction region [Macaca mulatta]MOV38499.1 immunoglobulin heavy chain junction region [Macaca mulatta]